MTAQMTEWYPPEVKPARIGWYQTARQTFMADSFWDGLVWRSLNGYELACQDFNWRELAADPAVTK